MVPIATYLYTYFVEMSKLPKRVLPFDDCVMTCHYTFINNKGPIGKEDVEGIYNIKNDKY